MKVKNRDVAFTAINSSVERTIDVASLLNSLSNSIPLYAKIALVFVILVLSLFVFLFSYCVLFFSYNRASLVFGFSLIFVSFLFSLIILYFVRLPVGEVMKMCCLSSSTCYTLLLLFALALFSAYLLKRFTKRGGANDEK